MVLKVFDAKEGTMVTAQTGTSSRPTGSDPNFLDRQPMEVSLPEDPVFTPILEICVFNKVHI